MKYTTLTKIYYTALVKEGTPRNRDSIQLGDIDMLMLGHECFCRYQNDVFHILTEKKIKNYHYAPEE